MLIVSFVNIVRFYVFDVCLESWWGRFSRSFLCKIYFKIWENEIDKFDLVIEGGGDLDYSSVFLLGLFISCVR